MLTTASQWVTWGAWSFNGSPLRPWAFMVGWALVCLWLTRMTVRSPRRKRRIARLLLSLLAVTALALLGLRPFHQSEIAAQSALLLTPGVAGRTVADFLEGRTGRKRIFALAGAVLEDDADFSIIPIPDVGFLKRRFPSIGQVHLFGHGLAPFELKALAPVHIEPHLEPEAMGITFIDWEDHLELGRELVVQGRLLERPAVDTRLVFSDPGGGKSVLMGSSFPDGNFSFRDTPRSTGHHFYYLELFGAGEQRLLHERIAVDVRPARVFSLLFLEAAPKFDTKHLKRWLADGGNRYLIRTRISRDRYRWEYGGRGAQSFSELDEGVLDQFDLVLTDGRALAALSDGELQSLRSAVEDRGLGLLIRPDGTAMGNRKGAAFFWSFKILPLVGSSTRMTGTLLTGISERATTPLPLPGHELSHEPGQFPLAEDGSGRILVAWVPRGKGRIGTSLIDGSYRWILQGHPEHHHAYWKRLIAVLARARAETDQWRILSAKPYRTDHPLELAMRTADPLPQTAAQAPDEPPVALPPRQDPTRPDQWNTLYWPTKPGWHQVRRAAGDAFWFFVSEGDEWMSLQRSQKRRATLSYVRRQEPRARNGPGRIPARKEVSRTGLFALFLLACAGLWLERKWPGA